MHDCVKMIASNLFSGPVYSHNSLGMNNLIFDDFSFSKIRFSFASSWDANDLELTWWSWNIFELILDVAMHVVKESRSPESS